MRRLLAVIVISSLIIGIPTAFSAAPKVGGACTKINQFQEMGSVLLVCATTKGKKVWRKATSAEKSLYLSEKFRLAAAEAQKIIDQSNAEAARTILEAKAAADAVTKAAADKAAADKAAADKAAADAVTKAAADKAAADAVTKAAADKAAADKAAAAAAAKAAAKVLAPIFVGLPTQMDVDKKYSFTIRGVAQENCSITINYTNGKSQELKFSMNSNGTASLSITPGGIAGSLGMTVTCQKSGTSSVNVPVTSATTVVPKTPVVPSPTPSGPVRRIPKICIEGDIPAELFKIGCQDTYPFWSIDLCFNRLTGLAFSIYLDNYTGTRIPSFSTGLRMQSSGTDSPRLCPDPNKPLFFALGDQIPTQVVDSSNFKANYRLVFSYILGGAVRRSEFQFTVIRS